MSLQIKNAENCVDNSVDPIPRALVYRPPRGHSRQSPNTLARATRLLSCPSPLPPPAPPAAPAFAAKLFNTSVNLVKVYALILPLKIPGCLGTRSPRKR